MLAAIQKWGWIAGFLLIAITLFFWPFFEHLIPGITLEKLFSIAMGLFIGLVIYFDERLQAVLTREKPLAKLTISQGVNRIFDSTKRIRHLRIAALTRHQRGCYRPVHQAVQ